MTSQLCKLDKYQSLVAMLKPVHSLELHFKPDMIDIHMLNTSNDVWVNVKYHTPVSTPCSIAVDTNDLTAVKGEEVVFNLDGNMLLLKSGKLTHKAPKLADPNVMKRNKDDIEVKWPYLTIPLTTGDIKDIVSMIDNKSKYDFIVHNGIFSIKDMTNDAVQFDMEVDTSDEYLARFHGVNLIDVLHTKHFEGCNVLLGNDCPIEFIYKCEWLDVTYLLAPMNRAADDS